MRRITFEREGAAQAPWSRSRSESPIISSILSPSSGSFTVEPRGSSGVESAPACVAGDAGRGEPDLTAVLVAVGCKDPVAFQILYEHCARRVYGMVRKTLQNPESCAEVTQEVFLMVWEQGGRYQPELGHPMSWLMTLAHRRAVDRLRADTSRRERDDKWARRNSSTGVDDVADAVLVRQDAATVRDAMAVLSPVQHQAISLAYFSHLTYTEVAEHLGLPSSTVKTRIRDGMKKLRAAIEAKHGIDAR